MQRISLYVIFSFCIYFCSCTTNKKQSRESIEAVVNLKIDSGNYANTRILVLKDDEKWHEMSITEDGAYNVLLPFQHVYTFVFSKRGYFTKKISFSTIVPEDRIGEGFEPYEFNVTLYKESDVSHATNNGKPVGYIGFYDEIDDFEFDTALTKPISSHKE